MLNNSKFILGHQWCELIRTLFTDRIRTLFTDRIRIQFIHTLFTDRIQFTDHILTIMDIITDTTMGFTTDIITTIIVNLVEPVPLRLFCSSRSTELHVLDLDSCRRNESHFCA